MNGNARIVPDVLDPARRFTHFCKQVETLTPNHEPNLDLGGLTGLIEIYKADPDLLKRSSDPE